MTTHLLNLNLPLAEQLIAAKIPEFWRKLEEASSAKSVARRCRERREAHRREEFFAKQTSTIVRYNLTKENNNA